MPTALHALARAGKLWRMTAWSEIVHARGSANPETSSLVHRHAATVGNAAQVDEGIGMHELLCNTHEDIRPAAKEHGLRSCKAHGGIIDAARLVVREGMGHGDSTLRRGGMPSRKHAFRGSATPGRWKAPERVLPHVVGSARVQKSCDDDPSRLPTEPDALTSLRMRNPEHARSRRSGACTSSCERRLPSRCKRSRVT